MDRNKIVCYPGVLEIAIKLTPESLFHAISLAFWRDQCPNNSVKAYRITKNGLELYYSAELIENTDGVQMLPCPYDARQTTDFVMNWLRSLVAEGGREPLDDSRFEYFAGTGNPGGDGGQYPDNFVLEAYENIGQLMCVIRPAWLYYPR